MYASAASFAASGTRWPRGTDCDGSVPHVTSGTIPLASISIVFAYVLAPSAYAYQRSSRAKGVPRSCKYARVVASGRIKPVVAPASIAMLHRVMRSPIDIASTVLPQYSSA